MELRPGDRRHPARRGLSRVAAALVGGAAAAMVVGGAAAQGTPGAMLRVVGRALAPTGAPIADIVVREFRVLDAALGAEVARTDADGRFVVELPAARADLTALDEMGKRRGGLPWLVVLDATGKELICGIGEQGNIGAPVQPWECAHFVRMVRETRERLTDAEVQVIADELEAHAKPRRRPARDR